MTTPWHQQVKNGFHKLKQILNYANKPTSVSLQRTYGQIYATFKHQANDE